jgi:copper chaperone
MQFHIENMTCSGCARGVAHAIRAVDPEAVVTADPPSRTVRVQSSAAQEALEAALREAGFTPDVL